MSDMFYIYGRNGCSFCVEAINLLYTKDYTYEYHNIETSKKDLEDFKVLFPGAKTVPQIMHGTENIGGYTELVEWLKHYTPSS